MRLDDEQRDAADFLAVVLAVIVLACLAVCSSCNCQGPSMRTPNGYPIRQCSQPTYSVADGVPADLVERAFRFWDDFRPLSPTLAGDPLSATVHVVLVSAETSSTVLVYDTSGCITRAEVRIARRHLADPERLERIMIHEAGHVLGLDHVAGTGLPMSAWQ